MSLSESKKSSFAFHAQALGLAASLTKPSSENIPSLAATSLSMTGGESYSTVKDYNWKGLISFDEASAYTTGSVDHIGSGRAERIVYNTLSTVTVRNLNFANMVRADLLVARVTSKHVAGAAEPEITFTGSTIRNLVVGGRPLNLVFDETPFREHPTFAGFRGEQLKRRGVSKEHPNKDVAFSSLVSKIDDHQGYKYSVPEFGTIYVAQVLMKPSYRRISMLRFELGCPIKGAGEVAAGESNGVEIWPAA